MSTRKSMTLPVIITLIIIVVMICLFSNIKQTEVSCSMSNNFENGISVREDILATLDGKKINSMSVTKTIYLPEKYRNEKDIDLIKESLKRTLDYLGDNVKYNYLDDRIVVKINVEKNEILLLDNISFKSSNNLEIIVNSNTKSSDVITLSVGDNYTDGEFMKMMRAKGYSCK